jgi:hypothetical protein
MNQSPLPLPPEFSQAIASNGGQPLVFEDLETSRIYKLVEVPVKVTLDEAYVNERLDEAIVAIEAGQVVPWDPERIKREGRRLLAERRAQQ